MQSTECTFLAPAAAIVESRTSGTFYRSCQMFVFGDSFADTGNIPKSGLSQATRQWYYPYGSSRNVFEDGRFSDGFVQTDFIGNLKLTLFHQISN